MPTATKYCSSVVVAFAMLLTGLSTNSATAIEPTPPTGKWAKSMEKFEAADKASPSSPGGVVFVGSSSIRLWDLPKYFPQQAAINRGFGGSHVSDSLEYVDLLVIKHKPAVVVMYAGDNDLAGKKSPEQVSVDFAAFVKKVHTKLPQTRVVYIAVKPSISRWKLIEQVRAANKLVAAQCEDNSLLEFVDIDKPMIGDDGQPRKELFASDGLHLSPVGYKLWTSLVMPHLKAK